MLSDLDLSRSEVIIFENLENTAERLNDLEDSDKDNWATVAYLHDRVKLLEQEIEILKKENRELIHLNKNLTDETAELNKNRTEAIDKQKEILKLLKNIKLN